MNSSTNHRDRDTCIGRSIREGVNGLGKRIALQHQCLLPKDLSIEVLHFLEGQGRGRSHSALLNHPVNAVSFVDVKLRVDFGVIDFMGMHGLLEGEIWVHDHIEEVEF